MQTLTESEFEKGIPKPFNDAHSGLIGPQTHKYYNFDLSLNHLNLSKEVSELLKNRQRIAGPKQKNRYLKQYKFTETAFPIFCNGVTDKRS
jgi:hypothetical protein